MTNPKPPEDEPERQPPHDEAFHMTSQTLGGYSQEAAAVWELLETKVTNPLENVSVLRKLIPSGVKLSEEDLAAFKVSKEYRGATLYHDGKLIRPEHAVSCDEDTQRSAAFALANGEIDFWYRKKLAPWCFRIFALLVAYAIGGLTFDGVWNAVTYKLPLMAIESIDLGKRILQTIIVGLVMVLFSIVVRHIARSEIVGHLKDNINSRAGKL